MTLAHGRGHLTRSVLEGVAFGLRDNLKLMEEVGLTGIREVRLSGGGAQSGVWRQILADAMGVDLLTVQATEGAAFGAALLAGVGAGAWASVDAACKASVELGETTSPDPARRDAYEPIYERFRACYPALRPINDRSN